jgi:hypothetical protein
MRNWWRAIRTAVDEEHRGPAASVSRALTTLVPVFFFLKAHYNLSKHGKNRVFRGARKWVVLGVGNVRIAKRRLLTIGNSMSETGSEENCCCDSGRRFFVGAGKWTCFDRADFQIRNGSS